MNAGGAMATFRVDYVLSIFVEMPQDAEYDDIEEAASKELGNMPSENILDHLCEMPLTIEEED